MPKRVTVDENGFVVSVESFTGLKTMPASSKTIKGKKRSAPTTRVVKRSVQPTRSRSDKQSWTTCPKCRASLLQKNFQKHYRKVHPGNVVPSLSANGVVTGRAKPKSSKKTIRTLTPSSGANGTEGARVSDSQGKLCTSPLRTPPLAAKGWVTCDVSRGDSESMSRILWVWFYYFESVHREIASESPFLAAP